MELMVAQQKASVEGGESSASEAVKKQAVESEAEFEASFTELRKWVDTLGAEYVELHASREEIKGRYASAVKVRACKLRVAY